MLVSVIIPTKNEPQRFVNDLVEKINFFLKGSRHEVLIIDKSKIPIKVKNARVIRQKSNGLGNAILEGFSYARGDVIVVMDSDGSHRPQDIPKLLEKMDIHDLVIGSRYVKGGKAKLSSARKFISRFFCLLGMLILGLNIRDNMSGFIVVKKKVLQKIKLSPLGFKINLELMYKSKKLGFRICEVPIVFEKRKGGKSKATVKEAFNVIVYILKLKLQTLLGN